MGVQEHMSNMTNKLNAKCSICGKPYHMCMSCGKDKGLVWKRFCCCPEHYKIYQLVHGYTTGLYTKAEAKRKLKNIDTSDIDELRPHIRDILVGIMGNDKRLNLLLRTRQNQLALRLMLSQQNQLKQRNLLLSLLVVLARVQLSQQSQNQKSQNQKSQRPQRLNTKV